MAKKKSAAPDTTSQPAVPTARKRSSAAGAARRDTNGDARHDPTHDEIAEAAYHRYLSRRGAGGSDFDDWVEAERDLRSRSAQLPSPNSPTPKSLGIWELGLGFGICSAPHGTCTLERLDRVRPRQHPG